MPIYDGAGVPRESIPVHFASDPSGPLTIDGTITIAQPNGFLVAKGTRNSTTGNGTAVIAANLTKKVEYHIVKAQRIAATGDQTVVLMSGATELDNDLVQFDANQSGLLIDYNGRLLGGVNEAQYLSTATAITFNFWILYRLV